jgi:hypothetical protein
MNVLETLRIHGQRALMSVGQCVFPGKSCLKSWDWQEIFTNVLETLGIQFKELEYM